MKKNITSIILFLILICMLIKYAPAKDGATVGLHLWLNTILPTLLPFMILSSLIIETGAYDIITHFLGPIIPILFELPKNCAYPIFTGLLCGIPMGAKVTSDMVSKGLISVDCGNILISFCNNLSPAFLMSYVLGGICNLSGNKFLISFLILFSSPIITGIVLGHIYKPNTTYTQNIATSGSYNIASVFDICILNSFKSVVKLGGYIIIFCVIGNIFKLPFLLKTNLEITSGLSLLQEKITDNFMLTYTFLAFSFGGICQAFQTYGIINKSGISFRFYLLGKLITLTIVFILSCLFL